MRKFLSLALAAIFVLGLAIIPASAEEKVDFSVFQLKVEIDPMIQAFAKLYNEKHPGVNLTVETLGGGADYGGALKSKVSADAMPTIFMIEGIGGYDLWKDYIADMSGRVGQGHGPGVLQP